MAIILSSRRGFLAGAAATLFVAPAIVRAGSLMPVKALDLIPEDDGWRTYIIEGLDMYGRPLKETIKYRTLSEWAAKADMIKPYFRRVESVIYHVPHLLSENTMPVMEIQDGVPYTTQEDIISRPQCAYRLPY